MLKLEHTNILIAIFLIIASAIDLIQGNLEGFFNWGIFAMMYLVMDDYKVQNHPLFRLISGQVGVLLALSMVVYKIYIFSLII